MTEEAEEQSKCLQALLPLFLQDTELAAKVATDQSRTPEIRACAEALHVRMVPRLAVIKSAVSSTCTRKAENRPLHADSVLQKLHCMYTEPSKHLHVLRWQCTFLLLINTVQVATHAARIAIGPLEQQRQQPASTSAQLQPLQQQLPEPQKALKRSSGELAASQLRFQVASHKLDAMQQTAAAARSAPPQAVQTRQGGATDRGLPAVSEKQPMAHLQPVTNAAASAQAVQVAGGQPGSSRLNAAPSGGSQTL